jgi:predicted acyltransferase
LKNGHLIYLHTESKGGTTIRLYFPDFGFLLCGLISFSLSEEKPRYNKEYKMYRRYIGKARENYLGHRIRNKTDFLLRIDSLWKWVKFYK